MDGDEDEVEVEVPALEPAARPDAGALDAASPQEPGGALEEDPAPAPLGQDVVACITRGVDCTTISVAVSNTEQDVCVQMTIDNCGGATRVGLPVDLPASWRLGSASLADLADGCVPGAYDPGNVTIVDASGSIGWNLETPRPSELAFDVTLIPSVVAIDAEPAAIAGGFGEPLPDCDD